MMIEPWCPNQKNKWYLTDLVFVELFDEEDAAAIRHDEPNKE